MVKSNGFGLSFIVNNLRYISLKSIIVEIYRVYVKWYSRCNYWMKKDYYISFVWIIFNFDVIFVIF